MDKECYLCKSKEKDEVKFGEFMTRGKISVHYFCLLLSSNLMQNGQDTDGFLGFLPKDIQEEARRVKPLKCYYCKKLNANISCCASRCYKSFHLTCGDRNSTEHNFVGTFKSFCHHHVKGKKVTQPLPDEKCCICYDNILGPGKKFDTVNMIRAPCCKNGWFHKYCLAAFAKTAGYFFKCPLCNDSKVFRSRLAYKSIFIPDRDAAWELEPNAFAELLERPNSCSAKCCNAENGRHSQTKRNEFLICYTCGSVAIHRWCMKVQVENFYCDECTSLTAAKQSSQVVNITASLQNNHDNTEQEDEEIDVGDDFDVSSLDISGNQIAYEEEDTDEIIKPIGMTKQMTILEDDISDAESNSKGAVCNFLNEYSDSDLTIKPLATVKTNKYKIVETNTSENELEGNVYLSQNSSNHLFLWNESSDKNITSTSCIRKRRLTYSETPCICDSGTESDRWGSSAYKSNSKGSLESDCSEKSALKVRVNVKKLDNHEIERRVNRRFISFNDYTKKSETKAKPKSNVSECTEKLFNFSENQKQNVFETRSIQEENSFKTCHNKILDYKSDILNSDEQNHTLAYVSASNETNNNLSTNDSETSDAMNDHNSIISTPKILPMRLRSRSEDISKTSLRFERRRSCCQSSCSTSMKKYTEIHASKRPSESLESQFIKRSRLDSGTERCTLAQNHKNNMTTFYEDENNYARKKSAGLKRRSSRGRSPLSANLCDAYTTLPYVKTIRVQRIDKTVSSEDSIDMKRNLPEVGNIFSKNKTNIPQSKSLELAEHEVKRKVTKVKSNQNRPTPEASFNMYEILITTDKKKSQNNRVKHTSSQKSPKGISILPSNQTKIESFFKRI